MIEIQIRRYRGIESADIMLDRIALVQGPNMRGKSSAMWAARSAMTGTPAPDPRFLPDSWSKKELADLVRGKGPAVANIRGDTPKPWSVRMGWPEGNHETVGQVPVMSPAAAGVFSASLATMDMKDRTSILSEFLIRKISIDDFKIAIEAKEEIVKAIFDTVIQSGFQIAEKRAAEKLTGFKQKWEGITGESFGTVKYDGWVPKGWNDDLATLTLVGAQGAVAAAEQLHQEAIAGGAVEADRIAQLTKTAATIPALTKTKETADKAEFDADDALKNARLAREKLGSNVEAEGECPHCGKAITFIKGQFIKAAEKIDGEALKKRREEIAGADGKIQNLVGAHSRAKTAANMAARDLELAVNAQQQLAQIENQRSDADVIAKAIESLTRARNNLALVQQVTTAANIAATIKISLSIVEALKPTGIRQTVLVRELEGFNKQLAEISIQFGEPIVKFDDRFNIWVGEHLFKNESGSAEHRAQVVLQVAAAELDGSPFVIIDSDTDWDRTKYTNLCTMLLRRKMHALVSVRVDTIEKAFTKSGKWPPAFQQLVRAYWIDEKGIVSELVEGEPA